MERDLISWPLLLNRYTAGFAALAVATAGAWWYRSHLIQTGYDTARVEIEAHYSEVARKAEAGYRARERQHSTDLATITQRTADETRLLAASVARLAGELRNRPERPASGAVPAGGADPVGCTGAQLYRPDALAFAGEAARADRLRLDLEACRAAYDSAVRLTSP